MLCKLMAGMMQMRKLKRQLDVAGHDFAIEWLGNPQVIVQKYMLTHLILEHPV